MGSQFQTLATIGTCHQLASRTLANQPSPWTHEFVQSLKSDNAEEIYKERREKLEQDVRKMMDDEEVESMASLQLIDETQRLGLAYHFDKDIKKALTKIISLEGSIEGKERSLHSTALSFRLLRQNGFEVSPDVFKRFKDDDGNFKAGLCNDVKGLLSLYEASYLSFDGENILEEAKEFTRANLKRMLELPLEKIDQSLAYQVSRALELPLQRRMLRLEAREYVEAYSRRDDANQLLLELAVMDFNTVQSIHQRELQDLSRWWRDMGLANKLSFIRDRMTESFFCSTGLVFQPQFSNCRKGLAKASILVTTIDDIFETNGSLEELEQFTEAVERWNMDATKKLPESLQLCFQALYSTVNKIADDNYKEHRVNSRPHLIKAWADFCKSLLLEERWTKERHTPKFKDYLATALVTSSGILLLLHAYCLISQNITKEELGFFDEPIDLFRDPSVLFRLCNDLVSSAADLEGDGTAKSIPCYIHETGSSKEFACEVIKNLIEETWKKMNRGQATNTPFPKPLMEVIINLARTIHCIYQYGDGYSAPESTARNRVLKLLIKPIPPMKKI